MTSKTCIVVDAMGGDFAPNEILLGVEEALTKDSSFEIALCGKSCVIDDFVNSHNRVKALYATEEIAMDEHPALAIRKKKDSSIVVGCKAVKENYAQGFFSCGSTGACMSAATLYMGRIKGIKRPAIAMIMPSLNKPTLLLDIGANADCKPEYLLQFGFMGIACAQSLLDCKSPKVALLNIGEEDTKGSEFSQSCNALMQKRLKGFCGNAEGKDILTGEFDVIVTDGFTGNIALKTIEGTAKVLMQEIKRSIMSSTKAKIGGLLVKSHLSGLKDSFSADTYGGAQLLGVNGACIIGHGNFEAHGVCNGILTTLKAVRSNTSENIACMLSSGE